MHAYQKPYMKSGHADDVAARDGARASRRRLVDHPWLFVVLAFAVLVSAWVALIVVADRHAPTPIPLRHSSRP